jgi:NAD kinase
MATSLSRVARVARVVIVTRRSEYEELIARHATRGQAAFFLEQRGQCIDQVEMWHRSLYTALEHVTKVIPSAWRRVRVERADLDRFLFEPDDIVIALGQDGLVANLAKYLHGQPVIGLNPMPGRYDGVLVRFTPHAAAELLSMAAGDSPSVDSLTMVEASLDDGQKLLALNEIFIGHQSHQSARYLVGFGNHREHQSSSGLIVATGTGATGWARSIHLGCASALELPRPTDDALAFFVREPFPSRSTDTGIREGRIAAGETLEIVSEMNAGGVVFGDGIEGDRLEFSWGRVARIGLADFRLNLLAA